jgi:restriction endonuclease Mrr
MPVCTTPSTQIAASLRPSLTSSHGSWPCWRAISSWARSRMMASACILGEALAELRSSVAAELLDTLATVSPSFFEAIVVDLLHRMGYGASRADLQRVGGSGDGGIDGVISLDKLGLEKVYVQAKRWQGTVGRPEVQGFYGALAGQRANKGVFITTSGYTSQAIEFARSVERVVLVDGPRLAELMIEHDVAFRREQSGSQKSTVITLMKNPRRFAPINPRPACRSLTTTGI